MYSLKIKGGGIQTAEKRSKLRIAFVFSSKKGMLESIRRKKELEFIGEDDDEPPSDFFSECDSDNTINAIQNVLEERYIVYPIESDEYAYDNLRKIKPNLVFNIAERLTGPNRESHIPVLCEILGINYTGSDPLTLGICLVKSRAKEILSYYKIPNPKFWIINDADFIPYDIEFSSIIKPLYEGSSKGIKNDSLCYDKSELISRAKEMIRLYKQPVIAESFLSGREFTVGILGNYPDIEVLPIVEIDHSTLPKGASPIYSYEAKWVWDTEEKPLNIFKCPADISDKLKNEIEKEVKNACAALNVRDWARIDVRLDKAGAVNIIEVNPLPGILPKEEENSCMPKAARSAGYTYSQLIYRVIEEALKREGL